MPNDLHVVTRADAALGDEFSAGAGHSRSSSHQADSVAADIKMPMAHTGAFSGPADPPHPSGTVGVEPDAKMLALASSISDMRTQLHAILGCTQILQLDGNADPDQAERLDMMMSAGTRLLRQVNQTVNLLVGNADPDDAENSHSKPREGAVAGDHRISSDTPMPDHPAPARALRVLVVDDIATNREIASIFVRAAGHVVETASGGAEAVTAAATGTYDVILMDVRMPGVDGLQASRLIRALPGANGRVPIVALTAQTGVDHVEACREMGMNGHLTKPFRYDTLVQALHRAHHEMPVRRSPPAGATVAAPDIARGLRGGDQTIPVAKPLAPGQQESAFTRSYCHYIQSDAASREVVFTPQIQPAGTDATQPEAGPEPTWIDIVSPWGGGAQAAPQDRAYIVDTQFNLTLTVVGSGANRVLAGKYPVCEPPKDQDQYELHWLLYVDPLASDLKQFRSTCDLWRWSGSTWRSISSGGAKFTPEELYGFGWRYCGPCAERTVLVDLR